jgi:hypothetical protein
MSEGFITIGGKLARFGEELGQPLFQNLEWRARKIKGKRMNPVRRFRTFQRDGSNGALDPVFTQEDNNSSPLRSGGAF